MLPLLQEVGVPDSYMFIWCSKPLRTVSTERACRLLHRPVMPGTSKPPFPSMGSSGHGHTGPCQTPKLFHIAGTVLKNSESHEWIPATLFIMQYISKKTISVKQPYFFVIITEKNQISLATLWCLCSDQLCCIQMGNLGIHHWDRGGIERAGTSTGIALCLPFSWEIEVQNRERKKKKKNHKNKNRL